jgi:hypothetical protein
VVVCVQEVVCALVAAVDAGGQPPFGSGVHIAFGIC